MSETTRDRSTVEAIEPAELKSAIDRGEEVFVLDVRSEDEFEEWHIDDENVTALNRPYEEFTDGIPEAVHEEIPEDTQITSVCAKGKTSEDVAALLQDEG